MSYPPFSKHYGSLLCRTAASDCGGGVVEEYCDVELPVIDMSELGSGDEGRRTACAGEIARASSEWGFFQLVNHGVSPELIGEMRREQVRVFEEPFESKKATCSLLNDSYRWGTPTATSLHQFSWSEAFHIPLEKISPEEEDSTTDSFHSLREVMDRFATEMSELSRKLAGVLVENLGQDAGQFMRTCSKSTCFLRLNRYPPCPLAPAAGVFGLQPHTDSDFLTILHQDQVGGLQLRKDSKWVVVRPDPLALVVNIGDLFQAWSNDVYKSVEHKVMANGKLERYSVAYFLCPSHDATIGSWRDPPHYRSFTFGEYRKQVQEDVKKSGQKAGLERFLLS